MTVIVMSCLKTLVPTTLGLPVCCEKRILTTLLLSNTLRDETRLMRMCRGRSLIIGHCDIPTLSDLKRYSSITPTVVSISFKLFLVSNSSTLLLMVFFQVILTPTHLAIVMEYASGGELFERICNAGRFSEDEVFDFVHIHQCKAESISGRIAGSFSHFH